MKKMRPEIKELWIAALLSGQYPQTRGALRTDKGFCCLGVLCDLYTKMQAADQWRKTEKTPFGWSICGASQMLPLEVQRWAGLTMADPTIGPRESLAGSNDDGCPFTIIADIIRNEL